jgi:hypothetical protein
MEATNKMIKADLIELEGIYLKDVTMIQNIQYVNKGNSKLKLGYTIGDVGFGKASSSDSIPIESDIIHITVDTITGEVTYNSKLPLTCNYVCDIITHLLKPFYTQLGIAPTEIRYIGIDEKDRNKHILKLIL